ncbi:hypothetical protein IEO21_03143 [Rhodonia placenta]|uniref:C3H1-type domain-containing protein n=1 Tax=Rhodonia placenta TaxID=104341 RepID=A0A8H7P669_9APHY|nr:hypothetical protein IEO21_03143 [Postia placenta]
MNVPDPPWKQKTRPCPFYSQGRCLFAESCNFLHTAKVQRTEDDLLSTCERSLPSPPESPITNARSAMATKFVRFRSPPRSPRLSSLLMALGDVIHQEEEEANDDVDEEPEASVVSSPEVVVSEPELAPAEYVPAPIDENVDEDAESTTLVNSAVSSSPMLPDTELDYAYTPRSSSIVPSEDAYSDDGEVTITQFRDSYASASSGTSGLLSPIEMASAPLTLPQRRISAEVHRGDSFDSGYADSCCSIGPVPATFMTSPPQPRSVRLESRLSVLSSPFSSPATRAQMVGIEPRVEVEFFSPRMQPARTEPQVTVSDEPDHQLDIAGEVPQEQPAVTVAVSSPVEAEPWAASPVIATPAVNALYDGYLDDEADELSALPSPFDEPPRPPMAVAAEAVYSLAGDAAATLPPATVDMVARAFEPVMDIFANCALKVATSDVVVVIDQPTLKRGPSSVPASCSTDASPTSIAWSSDASSLLVSDAAGIFKYILGDASLAPIYSSPDEEAARGPIRALVSKDRGTNVLFVREQRVHILEIHSKKIAQTFDSHKSTITSLALSNDASLLATTSASAIHVHNLTHGSHTVLRGIPANATISTCSFHAHSRTRLLVGAGAQLLVYDTTRPSGAVKTIPLSKEKAALGDVVSIASSPFSKTLVAVACSGGTICLVDLDKEKGICRTVSLHVPLTALVFSPEGATLYAGTENGKVMVQDLRALDKPPRSITVSEKGDRVVAMSIQKKSKSEDSTVKTAGMASSKPLVQQDVNKNPTRRAASSTSTDPKAAPAAKPKITSPVATRVSSFKSTPVKARMSSNGSPNVMRTRAAAAKSPNARKASNGGVAKKVFSPPRSTLPRGGAAVPGAPEDFNISVRVENLLGLPTTNTAKENINPMQDVPEPTRKADAPDTISAVSHPSRATSREAGKMRTRTTSTNRTTASSASAVSKRRSLTPSPDLPDVDLDGPVTPLPASKSKGKGKMAAMGVLGLGTPEVDRWIKAGQLQVAEEGETDKDEGKRVGFASEDDDEVNEHRERQDRKDTVRESADVNFVVPETAMQVSPRRVHGGPSWTPVPSPLRNLANSHPSSPNTHAAANLLQSLLRDAMYDFRQETHGELVGLHLDMLRMGRGLRTEMRSVVDEFRGEMSALREENTRLRVENERLRRGY